MPHESTKTETTPHLGTARLFCYKRHVFTAIARLSQRLAQAFRSRINNRIIHTISHQIQRIDSIHTQIETLRARTTAQHAQIQALERLLAGTAANRPPGAAAATAALPTPAVAIIMPTHNRPRFIPEAIASVQNQSFTNWELVIVADGTTQDTAAAVDPFLADPRIRFVRQEHTGGNEARNRGIAETQAPLIAYLDDDNLWYPDFLARAVDCLATSNDIDVLYGALVTDAHGLDGTTILWRPFDRAKLRLGNYIDTSTIVHRRALIDRYGAWDQSVARMGDWYLMLKYTADKPAHALDVLAARYRVCDDARVSQQPHEAVKAEILRRITGPPTAR